jgi:hypothetical protein
VRIRLFVPIVGLVAGIACSSSPEPKTTPGAVVSTPSTTMSFADCQKSAEYDGGRYAVDYDNGVCTVQRPAEAPAAVSYANCDEVRAAGKAPLHSGDPGYSAKLDRDGDGVACS